MGWWSDLWKTPDSSHLKNPNVNPAGAAGEMTSRMTSQLTRALMREQGAGSASALAALEDSGRINQRGLNLDLGDAERKRQMLQQDISQRSAAAGSEGAIGTQAVAGMADQAAASEKNMIRREAVNAAEAERRADVANILQDTIRGNMLNLAANRQAPQKDKRKRGFSNFLGTVGNAFGAWGSLMGGGGVKGGGS